MPTFPTYRGELPAVLSPLNWDHYRLLISWLCFRPTALNRYLYDARLTIHYESDNVWRNIIHLLRTFLRTPAYRNLVVMLIIAYLLNISGRTALLNVSFFAILHLCRMILTRQPSPTRPCVRSSRP
jgi:hypothetical protein